MSSKTIFDTELMVLMGVLALPISIMGATLGQAEMSLPGWLIVGDLFLFQFWRYY
jgi:hypothetical protein